MLENEGPPLVSIILGMVPPCINHIWSDPFLPFTLLWYNPAIRNVAYPKNFDFALLRFALARFIQLHDGHGDLASAGRPGLRGCFATPFLEGSLLFSGCLLGSFKGLSSCGAYFYKSIPDYSFGACGFSLQIRYEYHDDMTESIL